MDRNDQKAERRLRDDERVDEVIRRKLGDCATGSLFEVARAGVRDWFSLPSTGRQLHLMESRTSSIAGR